MPMDSPTDPTFRLGHLPGQGWAVGADHVNTLRPRRPERALRVAAAPCPVTIDVGRSAVVVVDMQNDFCHPNGWFAGKGIDVAPLRSPVANINRLTSAARAAAMPVLWLNWGIRQDTANLPANVLYRGKRQVDERGYGEADPGAEGALVAGSWGAALIDDLHSDPSDITVHKHRFSGFPDSVLDSVLRNLDVTTLLFAGINIDRCVFATLTDAAARGYDCLLVTDASATPSSDEVIRSVLWLIERLYGFSTTTHAVTNTLAAPPSTTL